MFIKENKNIKLNRSQNFPGYEINATDDTIISSITSNPFFHGINILALSKKMKGFRDNEDLNKILEPVIVKTDIQAKLEKNQFITFIPDKKFTDAMKIFSVRNYFGPSELIQPSFVNFGMKDVKIHKGEEIGIVLIQSVIE